MTHYLGKLLVTSALAVTLAASGAQAETMAEKMTEPLTMMKDGAPVVITGAVGEIREDEFDLLYETDKITVELDRFGWEGYETRYLVPGESVTVRGFIDDDFLEGREIEAQSISLNDSLVYYYLAEIEPIPTDMDVILPEGAFVTTSGTVMAIEGDKMAVSNEHGVIRVDVGDLAYDPFDDEGLQHIEVGDRVYTFGEIDKGFFEGREIEASGLVELIGS